MVASWYSSLLLRAVAYVRSHCPHRRKQFAEDVWSVLVTGHTSVWLLSFGDFLTVLLPVLGLTCYNIYSAAAVWTWSMIAACSRQRQANAAFEGNSILFNEIEVSMDIWVTLYTLQIWLHQTAKGHFRVKILIYIHQIVFKPVELSSTKVRVVSHHPSLVDPQTQKN